MLAAQVYFEELAKYFITVCMALYTYECFAVFRFREEKRRNGIYVRQNILMFLIHVTCYFYIFLETGEVGQLFFAAFQQIILYAAIVLFGMLYPRGNRLILNNMCLLLGIGFVILTRISYDKAIRQFIIATGSLIIFLLLPYLIRKLRFLKSLTWVYALAGIAALTAVLILGQDVNGSKLSFTVAGVTFQPSEAVKILFVFFVASALYHSASFFQVFTTAVVAAVHVMILVVSRDLGSALIFFVVYVLMVYLATGNGLYVLAGAAGGSGAAVLAYQVFRHVQVRILAWQDPWSVIDSSGYQITQSLFAISNGGLFGLGLYKGNPLSIPFVEADFIFSAVAEELGIFFAVCLILICLSCFTMFMNIASGLKEKFYRLIAFGLGITYIFQIFLTIGGGTKFIPLTGVTLPLISYGGSSVLTTMIMFSVIEGLYIIRQDEEARKQLRKKRYLKRIKKISVPEPDISPEPATD